MLSQTAGGFLQKKRRLDATFNGTENLVSYTRYFSKELYISISASCCHENAFEKSFETSSQMIELVLSLEIDPYGLSLGSLG